MYNIIFGVKSVSGSDQSSWNVDYRVNTIHTFMYIRIFEVYLYKISIYRYIYIYVKYMMSADVAELKWPRFTGKITRRITGHDRVKVLARRISVNICGGASRLARARPLKRTYIYIYIITMIILSLLLHIYVYIYMCCFVRIAVYTGYDHCYTAYTCFRYIEHHRAFSRIRRAYMPSTRTKI